MTQHVILAYGRETELWRATFAVLSLYAWQETQPAAEVQTLIFTDQPEFFKPLLDGLPVRYSLLTPALLEEMRGPDQYLHRVKLAVVAQVMATYPGDNLLFCDSDTFFVADAQPLLASIQADTSIMHVREFTFAEAVDVYAAFEPAGQEQYPRRFISLIESRTFRIDGQERQFHKNQLMWNSGVLGLHAETARLLPDICSLNDALYRGSGWLTVEQIAFSLALPLSTQLQPSNHYVLHYWGQQQKALMDDLLRSALTTPAFRALSLPARLAETKRLTRVWGRSLRGHTAREGALYSLAKGELTAGVKCAVKVLATGSFDSRFAAELAAAFRKGLSR